MEKVIPSAYARHIDKRNSDLHSLNDPAQGLTLRGFWVGSFLSFFLAIGAPYGNMIIRGTYMSLDFSTPGAIFLFLFLIGLFNLALKFAQRSLTHALVCAVPVTTAWLFAYWPLDHFDIYSPGLIFSTFVLITALAALPLAASGQRLALNRSELILVYVMLIIVSAVCTMGLGEQILPMISAIFYYASPQNKWTEKLFPHLPQKPILVDDGNNNRLFYEGLQKAGQPIPYHAWTEPLLWWAILLLAVYVTMVCVAVLLRRQWMDRERLPYPMAQVGLSMIRGERSDRLVNDFFKEPAMWIGCAIPLFIGSLRGLHAYYPEIPTINPIWHLSFIGQQRLELSIRFAILGFAYYINSSIAAGIWVFHLLAKCEKEALALMGITAPGQRIVFGASDSLPMAYQGVGALIALALFGLWVGRHHLKDTVLKALGRAEDIDDSGEILSYRSAVIGTFGGMVVIATWFWIVGTPATIALAFTAMAILVFIGMTRIVVEAGIPVVRSPMATPDFIVQGLGSNLVGPTGSFNLSLTYMFAADTRIFVMATCANALKLIEQMAPRNRRLIFFSIVLALFIGTLGALWMIFHMAYRHGGINLNSWFFKSDPAVAYSLAMRGLELPEVFWPGIGFFAGGGVVMWLMLWMRQRYLWWPIHPIGFPIGGNHQFMNPLWFSVFLAWAVKKLVLRFGGAGTYRRSQVFFLGLIAGQVLSNGLWLIIDYFTGKVGNHIFGI